MNKQASKFSSEYLALMLGLGVNPIIVNTQEMPVMERPFPSLAEQMISSPTALTGRWQSGQGMQWHLAQ